MTLLVAGSAATAEAGHATPSFGPPTQRLAGLLTAHVAFASPADYAARLAQVPAARPLTGERTVLPVLGESAGADGRGWLHVRLPGRPNGLTGWIEQKGTVSTTTTWHIVVETATRRVLVYRSGREVRNIAAVVGKPSTPTPHGEFFVEEVLQLKAADVGAPFALALSARSNVLQAFDGGPGQIALHGLLNVGGTPGTAVSHGCVRLDSGTMRWLVLHVAPGVPVTIR